MATRSRIRFTFCGIFVVTDCASFGFWVSLRLTPRRSHLLSLSRFLSQRNHVLTHNERKKSVSKQTPKLCLFYFLSASASFPFSFLAPSLPIFCFSFTFSFFSASFAGSFAVSAALFAVAFAVVFAVAFVVAFAAAFAAALAASAARFAFLALLVTRFPISKNSSLHCESAPINFY